ALKMFTNSGAGAGTETRHGSSSSQNAFIGMAMGQASQLFDQQSRAGKVDPGADKQSVVNSAAKMALKMYLKGGSGGAGPGGLMGMAARFM
ncbi:MAG: hypothetical protein Q9197_004961, partial [Variospora fuerteventurae]